MIEQDLPASEFEIIVVDDSSTDGSTEFLDRLPEMRVLRSEGIGVAREAIHEELFSTATMQAQVIQIKPTREKEEKIAAAA